MRQIRTRTIRSGRFPSIAFSAFTLVLVMIIALRVSKIDTKKEVA